MSERPFSVLRVTVVAAQAATIGITWPLWQPRETPPELPLVVLPPLPFGALLLLSLAVVLVRPAAGVALHWLVLALAILGDQTREQPQLLSLALLLAATLRWHGARELGALQLAALWFWSGLGKLTSGRFLTHGGAWLVGEASAGGAADVTVAATAAAAAVGATELLLGILALRPRTRRLAGWGGCALHVGILVVLSPLMRDWNHAVWPWNAALAVAAPLLLGGCRTPAAAGRRAGAVLQVAAPTLFLALPIGFHLGLVDAPFAQQVYTQNGHRALLLRADGRTENVGPLPGLGVMLPPVSRILQVWFLRSGGPSDRMILIDERPLARLAGPREFEVSFPEGR